MGLGAAGRAPLGRLRGSWFPGWGLLLWLLVLPKPSDRRGTCSLGAPQLPTAPHPGLRLRDRLYLNQLVLPRLLVPRKLSVFCREKAARAPASCRSSMPPPKCSSWGPPWTGSPHAALPSPPSKDQSRLCWPPGASAPWLRPRDLYTAGTQMEGGSHAPGSFAQIRWLVHCMYTRGVCEEITNTL